jgi:hypothetical protein
MSSFYVYAYIRDKNSDTATGGTPYYIGKGRGNRAHKDHGRVRLPKDKSNIVMIAENISEYDAFALEMFFIAWYGRKDLGTGILLNLTNGGEGQTGAKMTEETRRKMSKSQKGQIHSDKTKQKISTALKGIERSEEYKKKRKENNAMSKKCTDGVTIFDSVRDMAKAYGKSHSTVEKWFHRKSERFQNFAYVT